ncbi:MAG: carbon dioxide concentrating mechanism protein CcmL [Gemmataceae bacterium]
MRIARVVGTVTLSQVHPALRGYRWILAMPYSLEALRAGAEPDGEEVIVLDELAAAVGQTIGFSEGREAAMPFHPQRKPVDAYSACIVDAIVLDTD